jgi:3-isopropylmalate dehydrogenase
MMFDDAFKLREEAKLIRDVVNLSLEQLIVTEDLSEGKKSFSTSEVGTWLSNEILK